MTSSPKSLAARIEEETGDFGDPTHSDKQRSLGLCCDCQSDFKTTFTAGAHFGFSLACEMLRSEEFHRACHDGVDPSDWLERLKEEK